MKKQKYYLGLDIGTDSVGYAVCDEEYNLLKFHGEPAWGSTIFDAADLKAGRRVFRSGRRRLDRRQARVLFVQELFAKEVAKRDERFFIRLSESGMWREDVKDRYIFFNDPDYTDKDYFKKYPTIHHLLVDLMDNTQPHDVRLVYLACAWLVAHRGHFLSNVDEDNIDEIKDFSAVYNRFISFFESKDYSKPWDEADVNRLGECLKKKTGVTAKNKELVEILLNGKKPVKEATEEFPFSQECLIKLLAGGQCKPKDIFCNEEYADIESISLGMQDEKYEELRTNLGDDFELIEILRAIYDWSVLADSLGNAESISHAKVEVYRQHEEDLKVLKRLIKKYRKDRYGEVFRKIESGKANYVSYALHTDEKNTSDLKRSNITDFSKYILKILEAVVPSPEDKKTFEDVIERLKNETFLPKQRVTDNRVIPNQLYLYELKRILKNAEGYLPFLKDKDEDSLSVSDKVISVFKFKLPYFVGPLNQHSEYSWLSRKAGKITPWNYKNMIDFDKSEEAFINRLTNQCTYLPGENVLPKDSLCYHKFMVLNELNNLRIDGQKISVELKQEIYTELFLKQKRITGKKLRDFLISRGYISKDRTDILDCISGIDTDFKADLLPQLAFKRLLETGKLSESEVESIIERASYAEDKRRLSEWIKKEYPSLPAEDVKYICSLRIKDFGRLSRRFLTEIEGVDKGGDGTGEVLSVMRALWETNCNLMELLSDRFTFADAIEDFRKDYYGTHKKTLESMLDDMYISNAVKRPIYRTLDIVNDIRKAFGEPAKIFIEMARGASEDQKGKRTKSRYKQLQELYVNCKGEEARILQAQLEGMGEYVENRLQGDRLYLYFMQFGKCAYSGKPINLEALMAGSKDYDIDHIYPQAYVKDDSIINNKVLVLSVENGAKKDIYPIKSEIREKMKSTWDYWRNVGCISEEKYRRLTRATGFSEEEKYGFINRQLTETSQSTKAVAAVLKEKFPNTEIIYTKARLASEFRQEYEIFKSRSFNDLHHAVDAYLNIVTGNVYNSRFTKKYFNINEKYSVKTDALFGHKVMLGNTVVWDPDTMKERVINTARKNTAHFTKYAFFKTGGLFDQMPVKKDEGLIPRKAGLPTEKYGGYNKAGAMFYIPVKYTAGKKTEILIMSVELLHGKHFLEDDAFAKDYSYRRIKAITGKEADSVSFPMGMRPWKVNTVLSLDGFRICITGIGSGGKCLSAQPIIQFSADDYWKYYLKKLEMVSEKKTKNSKYIIDSSYDKVSQEENINLYDLYVEKLTNSIYKERINNPIETLVKGRAKFISLDLYDQVRILLNIHTVFGRMTGGCDFTLIGGVAKCAATVSFSASMSNWKKNYTDVRLIDQSASGLWKTESQNLLDLL